ncbi:MAG: DEAD/DEAH box helicase [Crocinitomicaceae bacterium]|nr:DEAD/DEAH box helicase [Crocinitomicaceae bacterium]|tara:strand:+ start:9591 stop:11114 length:1524 start_codon:yes stop_codon:yes gene_type:complete
MGVEQIDKLEIKTGKKLYDYQHDAIDRILETLESKDHKVNLLYQLPTGGGKTVIFSEFARHYIKDTGKKVLILTHRIELCGQTSAMLTEFGVNNKIINSKVKELPDQADYDCFVAMVETLNNRLMEEDFKLDNIGLVIIDEAHYNSFRKLFKHFEFAAILGVTATPLSSNVKLPMKDNYDQLIIGESIGSLIDKKFLAKANTTCFDVNLNSLTIGINGDYTVSSSERLYSNFLMQEKLMEAYEEKSKGKKTLIFNSGIRTSEAVYETFTEAGYDIRHLDNKHNEKERREILDWFRNTPDAILTSVGILTTGFDEPSIESIILNRATKSLTLYHQMIGRGSRILGNKTEFTVIDLGNNAARFGMWDSPIDWRDIFKYPNQFLETVPSDDQIQRNFTYKMPDELRQRFKNSDEVTFDIKAEYKVVLSEKLKPRVALDRSIEQHVQMCLDNAEDVFDALELAGLLVGDIESRVRHYSYCINGTQNYTQWLEEDYIRKMKATIREKKPLPV